MPSLLSAPRSFASRAAAVKRLRKAGTRAAAARAPERSLQRVPTEDVRPAETSASAAEIASVVDHPAIVVTRPIEWGSVLLGYEQANRYEARNQDGEVGAWILVDQGGQH